MLQEPLEKVEIDSTEDMLLKLSAVRLVQIVTVDVSVGIKEED